MNDYERHLFLLLLEKKDKEATSFLEINGSDIDINKTISVMPENIANENVIYSNDILLQNTRLRRYNGYSFLAIASMNGLINFATEFFCRVDEDFFATNKKFDSSPDSSQLRQFHPAYLAYENKQIRILRLFLGNQYQYIFFDVIRADRYHMVIMLNEINLLRSFVEQKKYKNLTILQPNVFGDSILHVAVLFENIDMVNYILQKFPNLINEVNYEGDTALHLACFLNNNAIIESLVNFVCYDDQTSNKIECNVNILNNKRFKPIYFISNSNIEGMNILMSKMGYDAIFEPNKEGLSPVKKLSSKQNTLSPHVFHVSMFNKVEQKNQYNVEKNSQVSANKTRFIRQASSSAHGIKLKKTPTTESSILMKKSV